MSGETRVSVVFRSGTVSLAPETPRRAKVSSRNQFFGEIVRRKIITKTKERERERESNDLFAQRSLRRVSCRVTSCVVHEISKRRSKQTRREILVFGKTLHYCESVLFRFYVSKRKTEYLRFNRCDQ